MYAATVDSQRLTFQASGALWKDALVMEDLETKSRWSQVTGEAILGELTGQHLPPLATGHMSFAEFRERYPDGKVLAKPALGPAGSTYSRYFADPDRLGIFGRKNDLDRLPAKQLIFGLGHPNDPVAIDRALLRRQPWYVHQGAESRWLIVYESGSEAVTAWDITDVDDGATVETDTIFVGTTPSWDASSGQALVAGQSDLSPAPVMTAFWFAWFTFFPETELIRAD